MRALRVGPTCAALRALAATGRIDAATCDTLIDHYRFLRRVEHRLQMVEDAQTHRLPPDRAGVARLAVFLGYPDPDAFVAELCARLGSVEKHYAELFEEAPSLAGPGNLCSPAPRTIPRRWRRSPGSGLASRRGSRQWCAAGITAASAPPAASGRARS